MRPLFCCRDWARLSAGRVGHAAVKPRSSKHPANLALRVLNGLRQDVPSARSQPLAASFRLSAYGHLSGTEALAGAENVSHGFNPELHTSYTMVRRGQP